MFGRTLCLGNRGVRLAGSVKSEKERRSDDSMHHCEFCGNGAGKGTKTHIMRTRPGAIMSFPPGQEEAIAPAHFYASPLLNVICNIGGGPGACCSLPSSKTTAVHATAIPVRTRLNHMLSHKANGLLASNGGGVIFEMIARASNERRGGPFSSMRHSAEQVSLLQCYLSKHLFDDEAMKYYFTRPIHRPARVMNPQLA